MKIGKIEHDHKLTNLLKVSIFSILMLAPLISIVTRCAYVVCNKNAYLSYSDTYIEKTQEITSYTQFEQGLNYAVVYRENQNTPNQDITIWYSSINVDWSNYGVENLEYDSFAILQNNTIRVYLKTDHTTYYNTQAVWGNTLKQIYFTFSQSGNENRFGQGNTRYMLIAYAPDSLDNVFDYSVNQLTNSPVFNWTRNTAIYTAVNNMTTQLQMPEGAIQILITYWAFIIAIYIVFDIVITTFTMLTHMLQKRSKAD